MADPSSPRNDLAPRIQEAWTRGAHVYDADPVHGLSSSSVAEAWKRVLGETLGPEALDILDVGAGTGFLTVLAAELGHRCTGLDLTPAMLENARRRAEASGVAVHWREGDAMALPFPDASFDAVVSRHVLWTMPDPARALREWVRVVRVGGRVFWFDTLSPDPPWLAGLRRRVGEALRRLAREPDYSGVHHYHGDLYERLPLYGARSWEPLRRTLQAIGVDDAEFRWLRALGRAERATWPWHRRLGHGGRRYTGSFAVTAALHERVHTHAAP